MQCYVVDAFAEKIFEGNPAAVCLMESWPADNLMQSIAMENNLSETAFTVKEGDFYHLRWFTPGGEIDLCGHATLAAGYIALNIIEPDRICVVFQTRSGELTVNKIAGLYEMDLPAYELLQIDVSENMEKVLGVRPSEAWMARDLICIVDDEEIVKNIVIDSRLALELDGLLLHVTAKGAKYDCISRSFAPKLNVDEDPVCGSGHCQIAPLWSKKLGKSSIAARQASKRGGNLYCNVEGGRVKISGGAALYSCSTLYVDRVSNL